MAERLEELTLLEILELGDGGTFEISPISWKLGKTTIRTPKYPEGKEIKVLRLWVRPEDKLLGPNYWDITAQTLIAQLLPYFQTAQWRGKTFRITKHGIPPMARFTLEVR